MSRLVYADYLNILQSLVDTGHPYGDAERRMANAMNKRGMMSVPEALRRLRADFQGLRIARERVEVPDDGFVSLE